MPSSCWRRCSHRTSRWRGTGRWCSSRAAPSGAVCSYTPCSWVPRRRPRPPSCCCPPSLRKCSFRSLSSSPCTFRSWTCPVWRSGCGAGCGSRNLRCLPSCGCCGPLPPLPESPGPWWCVRSSSSCGAHSHSNSMSCPSFRRYSCRRWGRCSRRVWLCCPTFRSWSRCPCLRGCLWRPCRCCWRSRCRRLCRCCCWASAQPRCRW